MADIFSFFSGAGFLDLGFEDENFEVVFVNQYFAPFLDAYRYSRNRMGYALPKYGYHPGSVADLLEGQNMDALAQHMQQWKFNRVLLDG